ncbi:beta-lactamase/transpeptidase-like protein [Aspergillus falconensis]
MKEATRNFIDSLHDIMYPTIFSLSTAVDPDLTSFAVQVYSARDSKPLLEYFHTATTARNNTLGVNHINEDTVFRIGSCSKIWTVLLLLMETGDALFHEPVSKYFPEVRDAIEDLDGDVDDVDHARWEDVTIGDLVSQTSGMERSYGLGDHSATPDLMERLGYPPLEEEEAPECGLQPTCHRDQFFKGMMSRHPVVPVSSTPIYSNDAFVLLGYILEALTGQSYDELVQGRLIERLNLTRSSSSKPADELGIIPGLPNVTIWDVDLGNIIPTGGIYSSTKDLNALGRAILNSELLSPAMTRRWLKPRAHTADPAFSVGGPWEIFTLTEPRVIDLYTKSGDLGSYSSMMGFSPDHDVGFTILAAGQGTHNTVWALGDLISTIIIPALDAAGKEEAAPRFAGTYGSGNDTLKIITDDGPGLKVTEWKSKGKDMLESLNMLQWGGPYEDIDVRLYPSGLKSPGQAGQKSQTMVSFRSVVSSPVPVRAGPMTRTCLAWLAVDGQVYGSVGIDEFVFQVGEDGDAVRVSPRVLRTSLDRVR